MAEMNFPAWVLDDTAIPVNALVAAKKIVYTFAACEKLRLLHNAAWKWVRGGELSSGDEIVLREVFPNYPDGCPSEHELRGVMETWWEPRQHAAQTQRALLRGRMTAEHLSFVDLQRLV